MSDSGSREAVVPLSLDAMVAAMRAASEDTRLRILVLLAQGELSVSDLTDILGQSQPRISRHLKVMVEAGLVERHREGAWAFFRIAEASARPLLGPILRGLDPDDARLAEDGDRLQAVRSRRSQAAQDFFARLAPHWDELRSRHAAEAVVDAAILDAVGSGPIRAMLDVGTGTGRMLQLLGPRAERAVGLDASHAMLSVARANLARAGLGRVELRQGDIYAPPLARGGYDLVVLHQVLHYLDDPARALAQTARLLAPGGRLLVVDFAPHGLESLRETQAHRRLGFASDQIRAWFDDAGLATDVARELAPPVPGDDQLTVSLWLGRDRRAEAAWPETLLDREVA